MSHIKLLTLIFSLALVGRAVLQSCTTNDFLVSNGVKEYMRINNDGVFACSQKNLCDAFQTLSLSTNGEILSLSGGNSVQLADPSSTNELQSLSISGSTLTISNGNSLTLPSQSLSISSDNRTISISGGNSVNIPDDSPSNELQTLSLSGSTLSISKCNSVTLPESAVQQTLSVSTDKTTLSISGGNSVTLPDNSDTNELQSLTLTGASLSISGKNTITLPDSSDTNEIQSLQLTGGSLSITGGNTVTLPDSSDTNELQSLTLTGASLSISGKNAVTLPDSSNTNEIQNLTLADTTLSVTSGNSVDLNDKKFYMFLMTAVGVSKAGSSGPIKATFNAAPNNNFPSNSLGLAPWSGVYRFTVGGGIAYTTTPSDYRVSVSIYATNDPTYYYQMGWLGTTTGGVFMVSGSVLRVLNAGDVVTVYMFSLTTITLGPAAETRFFWQGEYLGKY